MFSKLLSFGWGKALRLMLHFQSRNLVLYTVHPCWSEINWFIARVPGIITNIHYCLPGIYQLTNSGYCMSHNADLRYQKIPSSKKLFCSISSSTKYKKLHNCRISSSNQHFCDVNKAKYMWNESYKIKQINFCWHPCCSHCPENNLLFKHIVLLVFYELYIKAHMQQM